MNFYARIHMSNFYPIKLKYLDSSFVTKNTEVGNKLSLA